MSKTLITNLRSANSIWPFSRIPRSPEEHRYLGQALLLVHRQPEAVRELRLAIQLDPDSPCRITIWPRPLFNGQDFAVPNKTNFARHCAYSLRPTTTTTVRLPDEPGRYDAALADSRLLLVSSPEKTSTDPQSELIKRWKASSVR